MLYQVVLVVDQALLVVMLKLVYPSSPLSPVYLHSSFPMQILTVIAQGMDLDTVN